MKTNITEYTEFKDIAVGQKFIDADGHAYVKMTADEARHYDARYTGGSLDYKFSADDRMRVQPRTPTLQSLAQESATIARIRGGALAQLEAMAETDLPLYHDSVFLRAEILRLVQLARDEVAEARNLAH